MMSVHDAQLRLNPQAITAPNVTISPWEKFDRPVVPKMSDSPIDVIAMIVASFSPFARTWGSWLHLPSVVRRSWPRKNALVWLLCAVSGTVNESLPSATLSPSGSESWSMRTTYVPGASIGMK